MIMSEKLVYTVNETAELLGMSRNGTYNSIAAGEIPSVKIGKKIVVPKARLLALLSGGA
jgi:excisionase family DNA binding protein